MGFLYAGFFFIISVFKISGNSWNLINRKLITDNFEKQNCVNKTAWVARMVTTKKLKEHDDMVEG